MFNMKIRVKFTYASILLSIVWNIQEMAVFKIFKKYFTFKILKFDEALIHMHNISLLNNSISL